MFAPVPSIQTFAAADGYCLALRRWDQSQPPAHVVCLHGIISHGGWYIKSLAHLASEGFDVHMLERRGSGLNTASRGDVDDWKTWLNDVESYLAQLPAEVPRILLGISWGGILASAVAQHRPDLLAGVGLICPGLFSQNVGKIWQRIALQFAGAAGLSNMRVEVPLKDPALFTGVAQQQHFIAADPLALRRITIRFAQANVRLTGYASSSPESIPVPTLGMLGQEDRIIVNQRVREFVQNVRHEHKRVIEYPGAGHTLEFEPDPLPYFRDLASWCQEIATLSDTY